MRYSLTSLVLLATFACSNSSAPPERPHAQGGGGSSTSAGGGGGGGVMRRVYRRDLNRSVPVDVAFGPCMDAELGDLDGDGDLDVALAMEGPANVVLENDGSGHFSVRTIFAIGVTGDSEDAVMVDLDDDGRLDLFFANEDTIDDELYLQEPGGTFTDASALLPPSLSRNGAIAIDLGGPALVLAGAGITQLWTGGATITDESARFPNVEAVSQDVEAGDVDGDGDLDFVVANEAANHLFLQQSDGTFVDVSVHIAVGVRESREAELADVDGDGDLDLILANVGFTGRPRADQLLLNDGAGHFTDRPDAIPSAFFGSLDLDPVDLDGDGDLDLVAARVDLAAGMLAEAPYAALENDGTGRFTDATERFFSDAPSASGLDVEAGDLDGDGRLDLYLCGRGSEDIILFGRDE